MDQPSLTCEPLPSAFGLLNRMTCSMNIALFLDYDGTLSPIVSRPELATIDIRTRNLISLLARRFPTSIVSGRSQEQLVEFVRINEIFYASSHGLRIVGPHGSKLECDQGKPFKYLMDRVYRELGLLIAELPGIVLEHGVYTIAIHYRLASECNMTKIGEKIQRLMEEFPDLKLTYGKKVYEIRPRLDWDKGTAVEWILGCLDKKVVPIYVGDDITDEDAFLRVRDCGFGILVSEESRSTHARYSLKNTDEVHKFLTKIYEICLK